MSKELNPVLLRESSKTIKDALDKLMKYGKVFICRPTGFGKTYMLTRIAKEIYKQEPDKRIAYIYPLDIIQSDVLRKGSISARDGERVIIPMNMRDGSLICIGKGNPDWNYSAPHGAGRILSRSKAKEQIYMKDYRDSMKDVYTTCVNRSTVDESPMAYKPIDEIIENIKDTVDIIDIIKPIYNFKAGEEN